MESGTWVPVITADPTGQDHAVVAYSTRAFFQRISNIVTVTVTYAIETTATAGTAAWGDFVTLPIAPPPFVGQFAAAGPLSISSNSTADLENGGVVATEDGGVRLNPIYRLSSPGGTLVRVAFEAKYSLV